MVMPRKYQSREEELEARRNRRKNIREIVRQASALKLILRIRELESQNKTEIEIAESILQEYRILSK